MRGGGDGGDRTATYIVKHEQFVRQVTAEGSLRAVKATPITVPRSGGCLRADEDRVAGARRQSTSSRARWSSSSTGPSRRSSCATARPISRRPTPSSRASGSRRRPRSPRATTDAELAADELDQSREFQSKDKEIFSRNQIIESEIDEKLAGAQAGPRRAEAKQIERGLSRSKAGGDRRSSATRRKLAIDHATHGAREDGDRAPHDGVLVLQRNWRGELAKVGDQLWPGQTVAEIPLLDAMEAEVFVLEVDGSGLAEKQPAEVVIEARPETVYRGKIRLVDKLAQAADERRAGPVLRGRDRRSTRPTRR